MLGLTKSKSKAKPQQNRQRRQRKEKKATSKTSLKGKDKRRKASTSNKSLKQDHKHKVSKVEEREDAAVIRRSGDLQERSSENASRISWGPNTSWNGDTKPEGNIPVDKAVVPAAKILRKANTEEIPKHPIRKSYDCFGFVPKSDGIAPDVIKNNRNVASTNVDEMKNVSNTRQIGGEQNYERLVKQLAGSIIAHLNKPEGQSSSKLNKNSTKNKTGKCQSNIDAKKNLDATLNGRSYPIPTNGRLLLSNNVKEEDESFLENQCVELIALKTRDGRNAAGVVKHSAIEYRDSDKTTKRRESNRGESVIKKDTPLKSHRTSPYTQDSLEISKKDQVVKQDSRSNLCGAQNKYSREMDKKEPIVKQDTGIKLIGINNMGKQETETIEQIDKQDSTGYRNRVETVDNQEMVKKETIIIQAIRYDDSSEEITETSSIRQDWESISTCSTNSSCSEDCGPTGGVLLPPCRLGRSNSCTDLEPEGQVLLPPSGVITINADSDDESFDDRDVIDEIEEQIENRIDEILTTWGA